MTRRWVFFSVSVPECSHKYRDCGKCLTECENGKLHKVSVVLQQMRSSKCDDKNYCTFFKLAICLSAIFLHFELIDCTFYSSSLSLSSLQPSCTLSFLFSLIPPVRIEGHRCHAYNCGSGDDHTNTGPPFCVSNRQLSGLLLVGSVSSNF